MTYKMMAWVAVFLWVASFTAAVIHNEPGWLLGWLPAFVMSLLSFVDA